MQFRGDKVARETQYFADPFVAPHGALNGSNGWTNNLEAREFANDTAICGLQHNRRKQRFTPETRQVLINAVTEEVEL